MLVSISDESIWYNTWSAVTVSPSSKESESTSPLRSVVTVYLSAGSSVPVPERLSTMSVLTAVSNVYVESLSAVFSPDPQALTAAIIKTTITIKAIIFFFFDIPDIFFPAFLSSALAFSALSALSEILVSSFSEELTSTFSEGFFSSSGFVKFFSSILNYSFRFI